MLQKDSFLLCLYCPSRRVFFSLGKGKIIYIVTQLEYLINSSLELVCIKNIMNKLLKEIAEVIHPVASTLDSYKGFASNNKVEQDLLLC